MTIKALESNLHSYLAEVATEVFKVREHLAQGEVPEAEAVASSLMADLTEQLQELEWDEAAAEIPLAGRLPLRPPERLLPFDPLRLDLDLLGQAAEA